VSRISICPPSGVKKNQLDTLGSSSESDAFDGGLDNGLETDRLHVHAQFSRDNPRNIEQVFH
jgi:hypothetical protein